jgi:hypothetical protein
MSNLLQIHLEKVERPYSGAKGPFWQFEVSDSYDKYVVEVGVGDVEKIVNGGVKEILRYCIKYCPSDQEDLILYNNENEYGIEVNSEYVEPEDLTEIVRSVTSGDSGEDGPEEDD